MGTHISFVRSSEYDKWSLRQLAKIEAGGNKRAKEFFRQHGFPGTVDFSSSAAERWRHELTNRVETVYPPKSATYVEAPKPVLVEVKKTEAVEEVKPLIEEVKVDIKPIVVSAKPLYVPPASNGASHKFRKAKTDVKPSAGFKAVSFRPEEEPVEQPLARPKVQKPPPPPPVAHPMPMERKPVEKKAFSSEDFEASQQDSHEIKAKLSKFKGQASISSDDYFGRTPAEHTEHETVKDEAIRYAEVVSAKASELKSAAVTAWHQLKDRFR
eukprot:CAMPEP_0204898864 /NCGR_PEP_ID=MMETSP1397-20131031/1524_1 /ASSEMBLY_ACC=CAM_ASM_000891 /TAXON_ID=49980 /ORGANISM="Climacostomum Climacostomum virens, Strain Stock W-24" /LENGTH=268 /DNA_ID=CAMNT_0052066751 /DNA_START=1286 /DNA_END=2092 /DNA_ORIENTATION=+